MTTASTTRPSATGTDRVVALDGLRAVALLIIMGYHFGVGWLGGGFFSLDIFYVLSGYLITGLLIGEYRRRDGIKLSAFWLRRARRLLPALAIVLVAVTLLVRYDAASGLYPSFRMSALSAFFYFSNWWQIAQAHNYFAVTGAPLPLTHTWSLAVEEQFYLVWPIVVLAVMRLSRTWVRGVQALLAVAVVGAVASATEMVLRYHPGADVTRLYFGTDTHAQSILIGAVVACVLTLVQVRRGGEGMAPHARSAGAKALLVTLGVGGLAGTLLLTEKLQGTDAFDYRGGFTLSALFAAAVIVAAVCVPGGPLARGLRLAPLVWLGTISYGAYLWHYPVSIFLDAGAVGFGGAPLLALQFATTFAAAAASYYLVERPVMFGQFWRKLRALAPTGAAVATTVVVIVAGTAASATAAAPVRHFQLPETDPAPTPARVVVLGDSLAGTIGLALEATEPRGTTVLTRSQFGCGLATGTWVSNDPPTPQLSMFTACNEDTPTAGQWPALDAAAVEGTGPGDVVLFVAGSWEVEDIDHHGRWSNITEPSFQRYLLGQMQEAVRIATTHGAHFDLATMPAMDNGTVGDAPGRARIYNRLVHEVASEDRGRVRVVELGSILSPAGTFTEYRDGVQIRTADGVHTPAFAPGNPFAGNSTQAVADAFYNWLAPRLWPLLSPTSGGNPSTRPVT